jgi:isoleucyl-tRNA synthetase
MYIVAPKVLPEEYTLLIADELNVKEIVYTKDTKAFFDYKFKPQLKTLGKKFGKLLPQASEVIKSLPGVETVNELKASGKIVIKVDLQDFELLEEDLQIETVQPEGLATESDRNFTVAIDTVLTDSLIEEGFVREMISKIQTMRKEAGFDVLDRICFGFSGNERLKAIIERNRNFIRDEVLADAITEKLSGYEKEWDINGENATFSVEKKN